MRIQILRSGPNAFWWRLVAANGEVLCASEIYVRKAACLHAIGLMKAGAQGARVADLTSN